MGLGVETIGIHDFKPLGDGKVAVSLNNGNMGAFICDEAAAEKLKEKYRAEVDTFELSSKNEGPINGVPVGDLNNNEESWFKKYLTANYADPYKHLFHPSQWTMKDVFVYAGGRVIPPLS